MSPKEREDLWAVPLRAALQSVHQAPVKRVEAFRAHIAALRNDLPRGALKAQSRAADQIERQVRRGQLKALGDDVCAILAEFGLRARIETVAQRKPRRARKALDQEASKRDESQFASCNSESRGILAARGE